jgi:hypothetical protein
LSNGESLRLLPSVVVCGTVWCRSLHRGRCSWLRFFGLLLVVSFFHVKPRTTPTVASDTDTTERVAQTNTNRPTRTPRYLSAWSSSSRVVRIQAWYCMCMNVIVRNLCFTASPTEAVVGARRRRRLAMGLCRSAHHIIRVTIWHGLSRQERNSVGAGQSYVMLTQIAPAALWHAFSRLCSFGCAVVTPSMVR